MEEAMIYKDDRTMCYCSVFICRILKWNEKRETQTYC